MNSFPAFCNPQNPKTQHTSMTPKWLGISVRIFRRGRSLFWELEPAGTWFPPPVFGHVELEISETSQDVAVVRCGFQDSNETDVKILCWFPDFLSLRNLESKPWRTLHHEGLASQICNLKMGWRFPLIKHQRQFVEVLSKSKPSDPPDLCRLAAAERRCHHFSNKKKGGGHLPPKHSMHGIWHIYIPTFGLNFW